MTISNTTLPNLADPGQTTQSPLTGYEIVQVDAGPEFTNNTVAAVADTRIVDQTVTATGSSRSGAYVVVGQVTNCTTVAASTGIVLDKAAKPGATRLVFNNGANTLTVYANGTDTIDGVAGSTGVSLLAGTSAVLNCVATGKWISVLDTGAVGTVLTGALGGTGVANTGFTITLGGNLATTGAFNTTFAQGATTTQTLPTVSSTLSAIAIAPTAVGATLAVTAAMSNSALLLNTAAGSVATLPAATGTGNKYRFIVTTTTTSGAHKILAASSSDNIIGLATGENANTAKVFAASVGGGFHSIQMPFAGTQPSGGFQGDWFEFEDVATNVWACRAAYQAGTTPTTPFSTATS